MQTGLKGRSALVTGGGTGIGAELSMALARAGARLAITYRKNAPSDAVVAAMAAASGHAPLAVTLDATVEADVVDMVQQVTGRFGAIDILVNNVGGLIRRSTIEDMSFSLWREVMAVNLDSTFLVTHHALPYLARGHGRIINVASLAARNGGHDGATVYAASKAAPFGFTRGLAKEVAPRGITVNALAPGFIEATPFQDTFTTAASKTATIGTIPVGRAGGPSDVAGAVLWLASDTAAFVTGTVIDINGGQYFG